MVFVAILFMRKINDHHLGTGMCPFLFILFIYYRDKHKDKDGSHVMIYNTFILFVSNINVYV